MIRGPSVPLLRRWLLAAALVALPGPACVEVNGGAIEVDWLVVSQSDGTVLRGCTCAPPSTQAIADLTLVLTPRAPDVTTPPSYSFPCARGRGTTTFSIPDAEYDVTLRPIDPAGIDLAAQVPPRAFSSPPVLVRRIVTGQVASLDVWTVRLDCGS